MDTEEETKGRGQHAHVWSHQSRGTHRTAAPSLKNFAVLHKQTYGSSDGQVSFFFFWLVLVNYFSLANLKCIRKVSLILIVESK